LCDEVKATLDSLRHKTDFELQVVNIDDDADLRELYTDEVPVVAIDGRKAFKYRLDAAEFLRKLHSRP
jgi:glutaredoxin